MAAKQQGAFAVVWAIPATGYKVNGAAVGFRTTGLSLSRTSGRDETADEEGEVVNITTFNQQEKLTVNCYPTGNTLALAIADGNLLPLPGDKVALIGTVDTKTHAADPGRPYRCDSADQQRTNGGKVMFTIVLERVAGISNYDAIAAS